jgi:hypothetical protein
MSDVTSLMDARCYRLGRRQESISVAALVSVVLGATPALNQPLSPLKDDFAGPNLSANWYVCHRDENSFAIVKAPAADFNAAQITVNRRPDLGLFALGRHEGCRPEDGGPYDPGKIDERAELWEADTLKLQFGTEVWYRFDMWIDPTISTNDDNRLVIGQWKEDGGHSPMVAQRFVNRRFTIDVEHDNDDPASASAGNTDCRIYVAHDAAFAASASSVGARAAFGATLHAQGNFFTGSIAHDPQDTVHTVPQALDANPSTCDPDIRVTPLNLLPDTFGKWTKMVYHIKAAADTNGLLEVWANDQPIVTVTGRIGFRDHRADKQYFKFGPYRNHVPYTTAAMLANYARGSTSKDVE